MGRNKYSPAYIDLSVECSRCGAVLYAGAYTPGMIGKLKRKIKKEGWVHSGEEGTLCSSCAAEFARKLDCRNIDLVSDDLV